jgi:murein DD-endopeptidase MepM/ murein hydrolase activator NlpD
MILKTVALVALFTAALQLTPSAYAQATGSAAAVEPTQPLAQKIIAHKFAYPVGKTETVTQAKDRKDAWYNANDFGVKNHLGEDWNKNSGGNTDCGEAVFAIGAGRIVYADNAGKGWGNVVIIDHTLPDGTRVQSLYGHLQRILKTSGEVKLREKIGEVGGADGKYQCHLHLELREESCPMWGKTGPGYAIDRRGWLDPSDFIDKHR